MGLGFIAVFLGSALTVPLLMRLAPRLSTMDSRWLVLLVDYSVRRLWILGVLPVLCYGLARIIPIRPLSTAIGAALTGELIILALDVLSGSLGTIADDPGHFAARIVTAVLGVALTAYAIKSSRAAAEAAEASAKKAALEKKGEYDDFSKEAERLAALKEKATAAQAEVDAATKPPEPPATGT